MWGSRHAARAARTPLAAAAATAAAHCRRRRRRRCPPDLLRAALLRSAAVRPACPLAPDLYALIKTVEKLERAFVRDAIEPKDYTPACERLIGQYKTLWDSMRSSVRGGAAAGCRCSSDRALAGRLCLCGTSS